MQLSGPSCGTSGRKQRTASRVGCKLPPRTRVQVSRDQYRAACSSPDRAVSSRTASPALRSWSAPHGASPTRRSLPREPSVSPLVDLSGRRRPRHDGPGGPAARAPRGARPDQFHEQDHHALDGWPVLVPVKAPRWRSARAVGAASVLTGPSNEPETGNCVMVRDPSRAHAWRGSCQDRTFCPSRPSCLAARPARRRSDGAGSARALTGSVAVRRRSQIRT